MAPRSQSCCRRLPLPHAGRAATGCCQRLPCRHPLHLAKGALSSSATEREVEETSSSPTAVSWSSSSSLERGGTASLKPRLGGPGCVVASDGGLGARSVGGDAFQEVRVVNGQWAPRHQRGCGRWNMAAEGECGGRLVCGLRPAYFLFSGFMYGAASPRLPARPYRPSKPKNSI